MVDRCPTNDAEERRSPVTWIQRHESRTGARRTLYEPRITAGGAADSEALRYAGPDRLGSLERGTVLPQGLVPGSRMFAQQWLLDATDNWAQFSVDATGGNQWNTQQRFHNTVNEVTRIQATPAWSNPIYDARGNPISQIPQPAAPGLGFRMLYDPWDRLVTVLNQNGTFLAGYVYDGLNRRIVKSVPGAPARHYYYSGDWQVLDERLEIPNVPLIDTPPEREYVWGLRGLDDLILRERSTLNDGNLDERLYALADDNSNIVGIVTPSGTVQERYEFDGYGLPTFEQADFQALGVNQSAFQWNVLFAGYYLDPETGLYLARNRLFHPGLGRWLQRDPAGYGDSANLYQYCLSGPGTYTDPTGELIPLIVLAFLGLGALGTGAVYFGNFERELALDAGRTPYGIDYNRVDWAKYRRADWIGATGEIAAFSGISGGLAWAAPAGLGALLAISRPVGIGAGVGLAGYGAFGAYRAGREAYDIYQNWGEMDALGRFHRVGMLLGPLAAGSVSAAGLGPRATLRQGFFAGGRARLPVGRWLGRKIGLPMAQRIADRITTAFERDISEATDFLEPWEVEQAGEAFLRHKPQWFHSFVGKAGERFAAANLTRLEQTLFLHRGRLPFVRTPDFVGRGFFRGYRWELKLRSQGSFKNFLGKGYRFGTDPVLWRYPRNFPF